MKLGWMLEGWGVQSGGEIKRENWENCNRIISKTYLKKTNPLLPSPSAEVDPDSARLLSQHQIKALGSDRPVPPACISHPFLTVTLTFLSVNCSIWIISWTAFIHCFSSLC